VRYNPPQKNNIFLFFDGVALINFLTKRMPSAMGPK
jgi:hypothetical protein